MFGKLRPLSIKFEGDWMTSCLSYLIQTNHISSPPVEPVGYSVILTRLRVKETHVFAMYSIIGVMTVRVESDATLPVCVLFSCRLFTWQAGCAIMQILSSSLPLEP